MGQCSSCLFGKFGDGSNSADSASVQLWATVVDIFVDEESRWHSSKVGLVRSADILGDHVVWKLREAMHTAGDDTTIVELAHELRRRLKTDDPESRLLAKLADTGRTVLHFERAVDSTLGILNLLDSPAKTAWHQQLQQERDERMVVYETLLTDEERLVREIGDEQQQLEVLTLLRHNFEQYGETVLTPRELDVISAVYDAVVWRWNCVVGSIPGWFAASTDRWSDSVKHHVKEGEEACVRQAALWAELYHPNVLMFYGACHVYHRSELAFHGECYTPFVIERYSTTAFDSTSFDHKMNWRRFRDWAYGLAYIHDRGLVYQSLSGEALLYYPFDKKGVLSGMGLVRRHGAGEDDTSQRKGEPSAAADVLAFGLIIFARLWAVRGSDGASCRILSNLNIFLTLALNS